MKDKLVPILIFLGVAFATYNFQDKVTTIQGLIDNMRGSMATVINNAPRNANYSLQYIGDTIISNSVRAYTAYLLAPRHITTNLSAYDTMITVCDKRMYEQSKHKIEDGRGLLMKTEDKQYYYIQTYRK